VTTYKSAPDFLKKFQLYVSENLRRTWSFICGSSGLFVSLISLPAPIGTPNQENLLKPPLIEIARHTGITEAFEARSNVFCVEEVMSRWHIEFTKPIKGHYCDKTEWKSRAFDSQIRRLCGWLDKKGSDKAIFVITWRNRLPRSFENSTWLLLLEKILAISYAIWSSFHLNSPVRQFSLISPSSPVSFRI
jgi:hypothetical protein